MQIALISKRTHVTSTWRGLTSPPEILTVELKAYEKIPRRKGGRDKYRFLFSNVYLDDTLQVPTGMGDTAITYNLQALVKLGGKDHEHAVAYVRAGVASVLCSAHSHTWKYESVVLGVYVCGF